MRTNTILAGAGLLFLAAACSSSGSDGHSALVDLAAVDAGEHCALGGTQVTAGRDDNGNGELDSDEIATTRYLCNGDSGANGSSGAVGAPGSDGEEGATGPTGTNGTDGANGTGVALVITAEAAGENCEFGGQQITTGPDADGNGVPETATDTAYVCSPAPAGAAVAGFRLVGKFTAPGGPIAEIVSASPNGNNLAYTSSATQTIGFADIANPAAPTLLGTVSLAGTTSGNDAEPTSLQYSPDGQYVVVVVKDTGNPLAADAGALVIVRTSDRSIVGQVALGVGPDSVKLTPDGRKAIVAIEDEENENGNNAPQTRAGSLQIVTLNYATPASSTVTTIALTPTTGNMPTDVQPEYVDISADGKTAIVSLQENNLLSVVDLTTNTVTRYIDAGISTHARADLLNDKAWTFTQTYRGQAQPDGTCFLPDGVHVLTANEGDTANGSFPVGSAVHAGGRGFSIFHVEGTRVYDSGDAAEWAAYRAGAYPDARSTNRGIEPEGCGVGTFGGTTFAFITGERNSSVYVVDVSRPSTPVIRQILGAPSRPESATAIASRGLFVVGGEGNGTTAGGGIWLYEAVFDASDAGHGAHVYDARTSGTRSFGALSGLTYDATTGNLLAIPDNAYAAPRIWSFAVDHGTRHLELIDELLLRDASGNALTGIDPEGLVVNPEGGYIVATEGVAGNAPTATCVGGTTSNRILFFTPLGQLDTRVNTTGIIDLPCGIQTNAFDWTRMTGNGFEGVTVVDRRPNAAGGLKVYVAFQRPLTGETLTRIGEYDVDAATWSFYFYPLETDVGGASGNTFLSELVHVGEDRFAVIERDQGVAAAARNKTIRTFELGSGTPNNDANPLEKTTAVDLLADPFRFDQEKIEGIALGGGSLFVVNDNDGGQAQNFFVRFSSTVLGGRDGGSVPETLPEVVVNEVNSSGNDFIELYNSGASAVDLSNWKLSDSDPTHVYVLPTGTTIAPGGYLVVEGDWTSTPPALSFGLGSADTVNLYTPNDQLASSVSWTAHVATGSRCPNGTGTLTSGTANTKGAANTCP